MGYSLQGTSKQKEGRQHVDRDAQFGYINSTAGSFLAGASRSSASTRRRRSSSASTRMPARSTSRKVNRSPPASTTSSTRTSERPSPTASTTWAPTRLGLGRRGRRHGQLSPCPPSSAGGSRWDDPDTPSHKAPNLRRLGGSNGYRLRTWKVELAKLAEETGLEITVCHFPPGTSKWNKIEHRMFSFITMNWRGRPLVTYRTVVQLIAGTTTKKG